MSEPRNDCLHPEGYWDDEDLLDYVSSNDHQESFYSRCPRCKGTGLDRWEEDDCTTCFGEGQVANDLPNAAPIVNRIDW